MARRAVEQRYEVLRQLGVQPDEPSSTAKLREIERMAVGKEMGARLGQNFLPTGPAAAYAVVSDVHRFIVLRATASLRAAQGKKVAVARDAEGRPMVRAAVGKDLGR